MSRGLKSSFVGIAIFLAACYGQVSAADPKPTEWTPEMSLRVKGVGDVEVSPEGTRVAFAVSTPAMDSEKSEWISQIHVGSTDGRGVIQLTRGEKSATAPAWSPNGQWIAFLSPRAGSKTNIWRIRIEGGEAEQLTDEKGNISTFQWSPDGTQIAYVMVDAKSDAEERADREKRDAFVVDENFKRARLYVFPVEPNAEGKRPLRKLTSGDFHVGGQLGGRNFDWSPDSRQIVFTHQPTPRVDDWQKTDISLVEVASARITPLVSTAAAETQPFFSPDGTMIAYTASEIPARWAFAARVNLVRPTGEPIRALAETHDLKPSLVGWTRDGKYFLFSEVQGTVQRFSYLPIDGGPQVDLSPKAQMVLQPSLNLTGSHVGFVSESPDRPAEVYVTKLVRFEPKQVSTLQESFTAPLGKTEPITWKSTDSREVEGLLTYPVGYETGRRVPLLVIVHGGPAGVFTQQFIGGRSPYPVAVFAAKGYALLRCNVRGSSGYGREFRFANYNDWGGGDFRDIMSGVDALIERGLADPERLGIMGWSYGGYMTSWAVTQTKRFKAASVGAGVTNLMSFTGTADISDFIPDYMGGEYWDVFDQWKAHSAMFHVKNVTTPTLIQHGDKDLRVPISQGYEFYNALRRQGVPVKMAVYPREPHGLQELKHQLDAMQRNVEWFEKWLAKDSAAGG